MPYDPGLAERVAELIGLDPGIEEKKMFGGLVWMLNGNMALGVWQEALILRTAKDKNYPLLADPFVRPFDITGKPMRGLVMVDPEGFEDDRELERYVRLGLDFAGGLPPK